MACALLGLVWCVQEKYSAQSFKTARALRKKLAIMGVLKEWDDYFGSNTDFLNELLSKHEVVLNNMNSWASLLDGRFCGQRSEDLGPVLLELCKFCVRTLTFCLQCDESSCGMAGVGVEAGLGFRVLGFGFGAMARVRVCCV